MDECHVERTVVRRGVVDEQSNVGIDEQETVTDLEEVDQDDIDGEPGWVGRDRCWIQLNDADWTRWSVGASATETTHR